MLPEGDRDNRRSMHLIGPFAGTAWDGAPAALQGLVLPHLEALVSRWPAGPADEAEETTLTPPHERAIGQVLGLAAEDGCLPLAAVEAQRLGLPGAAEAAWAWLSPAHWRLGTEQLTMADPSALGLDEVESRAFLETLRPGFDEQGMALHYVAPERWLATHPSFEGVPCASLDRVAGRNVDPWLPADARARGLRRLQSEVQMLWHGHPLNEAREARGALALNSVWWSGCGRAERHHWPEGLWVDDRLRAPALAGDGPAWGRALEALDEQALRELAAAAARGEPAALTLCGERAAVTLRPPGAGTGPRLAGWLRIAAAGLAGHRRARAGLATRLERL
jgi:hypothetical protein